MDSIEPITLDKHTETSDRLRLGYILEGLVIGSESLPRSLLLVGW